MLRARDIPNLISVARIVLVLPIVYSLLQQRFSLALLLFFVAGVSDALDGYLAKRNNWQSHLGGMLDPIADKLLLVSTYLSLGWLGHLSWWLVGLVLLRDVVIVGGAVAYRFRVARFDAEPMLISKVNTFLQIMLGLAIVLHVGLITVPAWILSGLLWAVVLTTVWSGVTYVWSWGNRARARSATPDH